MLSLAYIALTSSISRFLGVFPKDVRVLPKKGKL